MRPDLKSGSHIWLPIPSGPIRCTKNADEPGTGGWFASERAFEAWFEEELRADGLADPARRARRLIILFDGAVTQCPLHHDPDYAIEAGTAAAEMIAAAREGGVREIWGGPVRRPDGIVGEVNSRRDVPVPASAPL